jgi:hypothetical protein
MPYGLMDDREPRKSGWDRDSILPFARRVEGGNVVRGGGLMGSDWHLAVPQFAADAFQAAYTVGSSKLGDPYRRGPENREAMTETAGSIVGPMAGAGVARNALAANGGTELGIFGGRMAKTADLNALARAERMAAENAPRESVWNETGWFQGPDQKWRFEILLTVRKTTSAQSLVICRTAILLTPIQTLVGFR